MATKYEQITIEDVQPAIDFCQDTDNAAAIKAAALNGSADLKPAAAELWGAYVGHRCASTNGSREFLMLKFATYQRLIGTVQS